VSYLLLASLIWAFSFGLIKEQLAGLDPLFVAAVRLLVSTIVFLPLLRLRRVGRALRLSLLGVGALQLGVMYVAYIAAFRYLQAYEVALYTVLTPIYVTLIDDLFARRLRALDLLTALLAVLGAGVACYADLRRGELLRGALLVQASNGCFAFGQIAYRRCLERSPQLRDQESFALLCAGGFAAAGLCAALRTDFAALRLDAAQLWTLLYLGAIASGVGFFLWNVGARRVEAGALAIWNNLKIPLAVAASLLFFGEHAAPVRLVIGTILLLAALALHERPRASRSR
jgi:drug/metabolite transporter (DMT)-like permease